MHILIVATHYAPAFKWGGPIRSIRNMATGLVNNGIDVTVLTTNAEPEGRMDIAYFREEDDVKIIALPIMFQGKISFANRYGIAHGLMRFLKNEINRFDVVHVQGVWSLLPTTAMWMALRNKKKYVITPRGILDEWSMKQKSYKKNFYMGLIGKRMLLGASAIHYTSTKEMQQAPKWIRNKNYFIVPNSIAFYEKERNTYFRKEVGAKEKDVVLGIFGRIHPKKGFNIIIPALAEALERSKGNIKLVVAGPREGIYYQQVEKEIEIASITENVKIVNMLEGRELLRAYAGIDILVVPSYEENFGNVIIEAIGQGTPVMVSEEVGLCNWVEETETGLVLPLDHSAWASQIATFRREDIKKRWPANRLIKIAKESFSIQKIGVQLSEEYKKLVL